MKKYVVYLFDGTTQSRDKSEYKDWSNIVRLHELIFSHPPSDGDLLDMYGDGPLRARCTRSPSAT